MTRICKRFENSSLENYRCDTEEQKRLVAAIKDGIENGFSKNIIIVGGEKDFSVVFFFWNISGDLSSDIFFSCFLFLISRKD